MENICSVSPFFSNSTLSWRMSAAYGVRLRTDGTRVTFRLNIRE